MGLGAIIMQEGLSVVRPWGCETVTTTSEKIRRQGEALATIGTALDGLTLAEQREVLGLALDAVMSDLEAPRRAREAVAQEGAAAASKARSKCAPGGAAARAAAGVVAKHGTCTTREVAGELGLSVSAATHRLKSAEKGGLVLGEGVGIWRAAA